MAEKLVIICALTGAITAPTQNPNLPYARAQAMVGAEAAFKAGASRAETRSTFQNRRQHEHE
jgi:uncharacterized protein (DUF849 family)